MNTLDRQHIDRHTFTCIYVATWLHCLFYTGTTFQLPNERIIKSKVYLISGVFDLPAKSLVLEEIQYNGFCGCSYCVEAGKTVKTKEDGRGQVHVYPFHDESITGHTELRTHKGTIANGMKSLEDPHGKPVSVYFYFPFMFEACICLLWVSTSND